MPGEDHAEAGKAVDEPGVVVVLEVELDGALHVLDVDVEVGHERELPRELGPLGLVHVDALERRARLQGEDARFLLQEHALPEELPMDVGLEGRPHANEKPSHSKEAAHLSHTDRGEIRLWEHPSEPESALGDAILARKSGPSDVRTLRAVGLRQALPVFLDARRVAEVGLEPALLGEIRDPRPVAGTPG